MNASDVSSDIGGFHLSLPVFLGQKLLHVRRPGLHAFGFTEVTC